MMRDKTSALDATLLLSWWKEEEGEDDLEEDLEDLNEDKEDEQGEEEFETRKEQDYLQKGFDKHLFV